MVCHIRSIMSKKREILMKKLIKTVRRFQSFVTKIKIVLVEDEFRVTVI